MNSVELLGRLTRDPEIRYTSGSQMAVATFRIAIDRPPDKNGQKQTDFPRITVFGRQAESCEKYLKKGLRVLVQGRIQTGSYKDKNGDTVYTTDVVANRIEFVDWANQQNGGQQAQPQQQGQYQQAQPQQYQPQQYQQQGMSPTPNQYQAPPQQYEMPDFEAIDEDVPY